MKQIASVVIMLIVALSCGNAQTYERLTEYEQNLFGKKVYVSGDYEAMKNIHRYWTQESIRLKGKNYEFAQLGVNDGVLKVTIPSRLLFLQDDSVMTVQADGVLRPFLRLLRGDEAVASVVIGCHSDNNGSDRYLKRITSGRASALAAWFRKQGVQQQMISEYGMGRNVSRTDNSSMAARERNRRVTLYLVPNKRMMKLAKKGKL